MRKRRFVVKKKGRALGRTAVLGLALLLAAGLIWGAVSLIKGLGKNRTGLMELPFGPDTNYTYAGTGFLYFDGGRLCYDDVVDDKRDTSYKINTEELRLAASSRIAALYHDTVVQIVGAGEPLMFSGKVLGVKCGCEHVAVLREDSAGATAIVIFDNAGIQVDQMDFDASDLVNFGFSSTSEDTLWTLETDYSSPLPASTITTYNLSTKRTTGVMTVQSQLVSDVIFTDKSLFISATGSLIRYNLSGSTEAYRMTVYGWELADYTLTGPLPLLLYKEREAEDLSTVKLYTMSEGDVGSAAIATASLPEECLGAYLINGRLKAYTATEIMTYGEDGKLISTEAMQVAADSVSKLSDHHLLIQSGGKLYLSITG